MENVTTEFKPPNAGCRTLRFSVCGFRSNFNLDHNYKHPVILKLSDKDG